jgi:50S ribosomal subunit-associated GTPase HflX
MIPENTDLERRVLAHEQILQVLIAHLAEAEPKFLERLHQIFSNHHVMGAGDQDYTDTSQYAEQFIRQIQRLIERTRKIRE